MKQKQFLLVWTVGWGGIGKVLNFYNYSNFGEFRLNLKHLLEDSKLDSKFEICWFSKITSDGDLLCLKNWTKGFKKSAWVLSMVPFSWWLLLKTSPFSLIHLKNRISNDDPEAKSSHPTVPLKKWIKITKRSTKKCVTNLYQEKKDWGLCDYLKNNNSWEKKYKSWMENLFVALFCC